MIWCFETLVAYSGVLHSQELSVAKHVSRQLEWCVTALFRTCFISVHISHYTVVKEVPAQ